jgi:hypothetical protein
MRHVEDVAKKAPCTCKQAQNNSPTTKQQLQLKPSCAALETFTSRKEQINYAYKGINQTATPNTVACGVATTKQQHSPPAESKTQSSAKSYERRSSRAVFSSSNLKIKIVA